MHLLPYHNLDVAAVCSVLLNKSHRLRRTLARLVGFDEDLFVHSAVFLLSLHDIGKFSVRFQNLRPDLLERLQGRQNQLPYNIRHDTLGFMAWRSFVFDHLVDREHIAVVGRKKRTNGYDHWMRAVAGHHGEPPKEEQELIQDYFDPQDSEATKEYTHTVAQILLPTGQALPHLEKRAVVKSASWWLAGLSVLCDWLGSNTSFFHARSEPMPLGDYWTIALESAERVVKETELLVDQPPREAKAITTLFAPFIEQPTPLQELCENVSIEEGPNLYVLEDVTGAGKTEAAILLAHRLMSKGRCAGVYFALPTMATANAMYERLRIVYRRLFSDEALPSLVLAHSARNLSDSFRTSVIPTTDVQEGDYGDGAVPADAHCSAWLADSSKKALLAAVGVGTVDQALMGILPTRHQSLRLLGLMDKVLVVDEVHACDAYMQGLLKNLLRAQAAAGGSAILLSATLPLDQRQELVRAFARGAEAEEGKTHQLCRSDFPLFTGYSRSGVQEVGVASREEVCRHVHVEMLHDVQAVYGIINEAIEKQQCVCWIRNTVTDARQAYTTLKRRFPSSSIDLFHARFAMGDRLTIEDRIVGGFGKNSTNEQRRGRIVVATQVVEQSLDVDFDVMITDLAPIDLILQRAGRLMRHNRDEHGNRIDGADRRGQPTLYVYGPDPVENPGDMWYKELFLGGSYVYPNHGQLWLTARGLKERGGFTVPHDVRSITEAVFAPEASESIPDGLIQRSLDAEGQDMASRSLSEMNAFNLSEGYSTKSSNRWWSEATTPTRLGDLTKTVYLGHWVDNSIVPWVSGENAWQRSAVQIRVHHINEEAEVSAELQPVIERCKMELPANGRWGVLLPLVQLDSTTWGGRVRNGEGIEVNMYYSRELGLINQKEMDRLNGESANEPN